MKNDKLMVKQKRWEEFKESGMLWFVNSILHVFGWVIVLEVDDDKIVDVYPARSKFRGFDEKSNNLGYYRLTNYMVEHANELLEECEIPEDIAKRRD